MQTYKTKSIMEATLPFMKKLHKQHKNPINHLKTAWPEVAPAWAMLAIPYMIKNQVLTLETSQTHAMLIQYREEELLDLANSIVGNLATRIKIITK